MELSKLEIKGFKSFGDKITINFDAGITGIVGPNGCGKSNVVDAMRWVLGEQKQRNLRSDKMENVIFNGTKNRKAVQMAEVSLTLNNTKNLLPTEYSEVTITRKYYRSGESEYQLNGIQCRLKDITNLFMDTGIGPDSYAIIELKMVDDILNDKNDSRRTLFEEAAGISKFKVRKKQTLKKLDDTDKDLERVEDLLFEIEKNLKSLERQAKQAEKYFEIKEEYKALSIDLAKLNSKDQRTKLAELNKKLEDIKTGKTSISKQKAEKDAVIEKQKNDLVIKEKALATRQKALNTHVDKIRNIESEKKIKSERHRFLTTRKDQLADQINQDKESKERSELSITSLTTERDSHSSNLLTKKAELDKLRTEYEAHKESHNLIQEEFQAANMKFQHDKEELYQLKKDLEIKDVQLSALKHELQKTDSDTTDQKGSIDEFESKLKQVEKELNKKKEEEEKLTKSEEKLIQNIENLENEVQLFKDKISEIGRKIDAKENEFELTKSLVDNLEGFPEAIKFLKKNNKWSKETILLSDIITCKEEYRTCIENYLETYLNFYIVDNESNAISAINMLTDSSMGRANFFVLSEFDHFEPSVEKQYENTTLATHVIEVEDKYRSLISFIFDKVYIVIENQEQISDDKSAIFITKNGKIIKRKNTISGGSVGLFEGKKIGRVKNLDVLTADIKDLKAELNQITKKLSKSTEELEKYKLSGKSDELNKAREERVLINEEFITLKTKKEQFENMINTASLKKEEIDKQISELEKFKDKHAPQLSGKEEELTILEERFTLLNEQLEGSNTDLQTKSTAFNTNNIDYHQLENKFNSLEQELGYKQNALQSAIQRIEVSSVELKSVEEEVKSLIQKNDDSEGDLLSMYEEKEAIELGLSEAEKEYYEVRGLISEMEKELRELQHKKESNDELVAEYQEQVNEVKLSLSSLKERLAVEFEINLDELDDQITTELEKDEVEEKVTKIKDRIERIGPINPMAKEAYDEIQERHVFIIEQKEDLIKAKNALLDTITEIDGVAKETFITSFDLIRENFIKVFRSLFTEEDSCDLKLADPEDPLGSEILITAKPKGKRPLTINQLSGGEKTLTAVSLLFSIYLLKPAPFCIFDEVDAPLDDANIDKFNNIIKKFSKDSQFIIVTHNKRTMSTTDVIYGITMAEQGVSRVVPVDLRSLSEN